MDPRTPEAADRLSDSDAIMWRIESDPVLRSPILVIGLLGATPTRDEVVAAFAHAATVVPRLRRRVVPDGVVTGRLRWQDDPDFHVEAHVRVRRLSGRAGIDAVLGIAEEDAAAAFDPARPPWTATLVTGLHGHRSALVLRFHHSITDGVGGVQLADVLFDAVGGPPPPPAETAAASPRVGPPPDLLRLAAEAGRTALAAARDPRAAAREAARTARSMQKLLSPASEPLSPVWHGRSIERRLFVTEVPLGALRDAAHRWDVTINDLFLGTVAGALHAYHRDHGHEVPALRFTMPVNRRTDGDPAAGNRFTPVRFVLPIDEPDPRQRARIARNLCRSWLAEPSMGFTDLLASTLNRLPTPALTGVFAGMLRNVDADASNVPGIQVPMAFAGAPLDRLWAFAPPAGAAMSVTLLTHVDVGCLGILADTAAVPDPHALARHLEEAFEAAVASDELAGAVR
ncbi:MAG TPA: wax ester/triacylglycerol synthase domain-containing protein [Acidimicrobiales bacterium]|nr:wax ester/triacylglycerol synthase domain-containing protein [Acidimicrobiales bacterium]